MTRPCLRPDVRVLRRSADTVQVGASLDDGVVLTGLQRREVALLHGLDGARTRGQLVRYWQEHGVTEARGREILRLLQEGGVLTGDEDDGGPPAREEASVLVTGVGELPATVVALLRAAGVGRVLGGRYAVLGAGADAGGDDVPDLEIILASTHPGAPRTLGRGSTGAVLPVGVPRGAGVTVGPLVRPQVGPCLDCLALVRTDLDPAWPTLVAQLAGVGPGGAGPPDAAGPAGDGAPLLPVCDPDEEVQVPLALAHAAAGLVAMTALAWVDGQAPPPGVSYELVPPWPQVRRRRWPTHPRCGCGRDARQAPSAVTMVG